MDYSGFPEEEGDYTSGQTYLIENLDEPCLSYIG